jgi:hypothetical protein
MKGTPLTGLEGSNPLGFLAALGVQTLFESEERQPCLWWSPDVVSHAFVDGQYTLKAVIEQALRVFPDWAASPALNPHFPKGENLKFTPDNLRKYLQNNKDLPPGDTIASALVAEGSLDNSQRAKPSDLYFTAGQQRFLKMARSILLGTTEDHLREGLVGPWSYRSNLPSLMWDVVDDRLYALSSFDPAGEKKLTNPGPEALAILGLSRHPVFAALNRTNKGPGRTLTRGCSGSWKEGAYTWPLWSRPAPPRAVDSLLAHATGNTARDLRNRSPWYRSWSVSQVLRSAIRRSSQGGYGTFGPPENIWP